MLSPDTMLQGRYRVVRLLGQGGMGAVYQATDERLDATVALKQCFFNQEPLRRQFEREARMLAKLRHPAMTKVIDHFTEADGQFLVMEFIPGDDLLEMLINRGSFPPDEVIKWGDQLLDALDYLHTQEPQIIHRDIKPQNLKLTQRGQIILLDFGLAKGHAGQITTAGAQGSIFGYTPAYAPLEQIQGTGTDPRSDLYSLAATLYHLMTGVMPTDALTRATALVNNDPDPLLAASEANRKVAPAIAAVLMQAMALKRDQRPPSADQMRKALRAAVESLKAAYDESSRPTVRQQTTTRADRESNLQEPRETALLASPQIERTSPVLSRQAELSRETNPGLNNQDTTTDRLNTQPQALAAPVERRSKRLFWIAGGAISLLILIAIFAVRAYRSSNRTAARPTRSAPATTPEKATPPGPTPPKVLAARQSLKGHSKDVRAVAFSPDGKKLASASSDGTIRLWDTQTGEPGHTIEMPDNEVVALAFSSDGKFIAVAANAEGGKGSVSLMESGAWEVEQTIEEENINSIALSPDNKTLAIGNISGYVKLWDLETGELKQELEGQEIQARSVAYSPNGKFVAAGGYGNTVKLWDVASGNLKKTLEGHSSEINAVAFSADSRTLASGGYDNTVKLWDTETGALKQTLKGMTDMVFSVAFSPDGQMVAGGSNFSILIWDVRSGALLQRLTGPEGSINSLAFSPGGKLLAGGGSDKAVRVWDLGSLARGGSP